VQSTGFSPYDPPSQILRPTALDDPSTPRLDASQVNMYFLFNLEFKFLIMSQSFMLQGSRMDPRPMMPWGGSTIVGQPSPCLPPPPAGYWPPSPQGVGFWYPPPLDQSFNTPLTLLGQGYWPSPMSWAPPPGGQAPPWGMPLWMTVQQPPLPSMVRHVFVYFHTYIEI
jgi:hypothetical protein